MTVHVVMLPTALPVGAEGEGRTIGYEDVPRGGEQIEYRYSLHSGGSLVVWRCSPDAPSVVEVAYSPSAWESAQGALYGSLG